MLRIQKSDLDSLPSLLIEEKIVGVSDAYFDIDEGFEAMCRLIREGVVGWTANQPPSVAIYPEKNGDHIYSDGLGREKNPIFVANRNWHADANANEYNLSYIGMSMVHYDCPEPDKGQTLFVDLQSLYERCPYKDYVEDLWIKHVVFNCDHGVDINVHPLLRTHPLTGVTGFHMNSRAMRPEESPTLTFDTPQNEQYNDTPPEFQELMKWMWGEIENQDNWIWWRWNEGDFLVWDNRCFIHSFTGGWDVGDRIFHRFPVGMEKPVYKPAIPLGVSLFDTYDGPITKWFNEAPEVRQGLHGESSNKIKG